jgi:hypothetical protein
MAAVGQPTHYAFSLTCGKVIPTNGSPFSGNSPTAGLDAAVLWRQADTADYWCRYWNRPYFGLKVSYAHVWNGIAGDRIGLAPAIVLPFFDDALDFMLSLGFSCYTRPYSVTHDPANTFIGSHLNCLIEAGLSYNLAVGGSSQLCLGAMVVHSSNGYMYKPNHGLNYLQADLGLRFGKVEHEGVAAGDARWQKRSRFFVMAAPSAVMSRYDPVDVIHYHPAYTLELGLIRHPHPCFSYGGALDLSYNFSHRAVCPDGEWPVYPAVTIFGDADVGPIVMRIGFAHYLAQYPLNWEQYYERLGLYYRFGRDMRHALGVGMKVHYDHIDYIEWTYIVEL